jgi:hypothetical protein
LRRFGGGDPVGPHWCPKIPAKVIYNLPPMRDFQLASVCPTSGALPLGERQSVDVTSM